MTGSFCFLAVTATIKDIARSHQSLSRHLITRYIRYTDNLKYEVTAHPSAIILTMNKTFFIRQHYQ